MFDLRDAGDADAHRGRDVALGEAELLAGLSELVPAGWASSVRAPASISSGETPAACSSRSRVSQSCGVRLAIAESVPRDLPPSR